MQQQGYDFQQHNAENNREAKRILKTPFSEVQAQGVEKLHFLYTLFLYFRSGPLLFVVFICIPNQFVSLIISTLYPLLGFWNLPVYFLHTRLKYQQDHPGTWLVTAYFQVLRPNAPCACSPSGMCAGQKEDVEDAPEMNFAKFNAANEQTHPLSNDTQP